MSATIHPLVQKRLIVPVLPPTEAHIEELFQKLNHYEVDFADVRVQEYAKRALVVAASGGHNVLML